MTCLNEESLRPFTAFLFFDGYHLLIGCLLTKLTVDW